MNRLSDRFRYPLALALMAISTVCVGTALAFPPPQSCAGKCNGLSCTPATGENCCCCEVAGTWVCESRELWKCTTSQGCQP